MLTTPPLLHLPDFTIPFVVETDTSNPAIEAVLSQVGHPIAFFSKKLCPKKQNNSVYVKEMLAIIESVKKWRHYLQSLSNYHRLAKFKGITYQPLPYTGATKMGFMTYCVQF